MRRRTLLNLGIGTGTILAVAGIGIAAWKPGIEFGKLSANGRSIFRAVGLAVLDGSLHRSGANPEAAIGSFLARLDTVVGSLAKSTQSELSQLLAVLATAPGRLGIARLSVPWDEAGVGELQRALQSMRTSALELRMQTYHALRDLTNAAFYADAGSWQLLGYPGPRSV